MRKFNPEILDMGSMELNIKLENLISRTLNGCSPVP
jgi:hypothetical protein